MSKTMTIDDLRTILINCAGCDDTLRGDIADASFDELGYDSLALIDTAAMLKREYGVVIPDEQLIELRSPGELLGLINERLAA
jgi:minimal PKS acyl carrier protein